MTGDCHVRSCKSGRVRLPPATYQTRTAGSAGGMGKRTGSNPDTAPHAYPTNHRSRQTPPRNIGDFGSFGHIGIGCVHGWQCGCGSNGTRFGTTGRFESLVTIQVVGVSP